jgi:hypothetical protein
VTQLQVIKRSGEREEFDPEKTRRAIMRVGVSDQEADAILDRLGQQLYDGISTEEIYRRVHDLLDGRKAAKYGLKKAIQRFGPDGENFEPGSSRRKATTRGTGSSWTANASRTRRTSLWKGPGRRPWWNANSTTP